MDRICKVQHRADCGVGTVWFVRLDDGYLLDCGAEGFPSEDRARKIAAALDHSVAALRSVQS
jgi:hypothetical protein